MTSTTALINQLITDLDNGRANGTIYTYGQVQERLRAIVAAEAEGTVGELAFLDWLIDIAYPFDTVFDPAPPVDLKRLALRWKEREGWTDVSDEDAIACIEEEANCG